MYVYSVPCNEFSRAYIGQTGRSLEHRIAEHRRALRNGDVAASALAEYVFTAGYKIDLSKVTVIDTHPHAQTHCFLESWHIQHERTLMQQEKGNVARTLCHPAGLTLSCVSIISSVLNCI